MFDENEHLVILQLFKTYASTAVASTQPAVWRRWTVALKNSPHLNDDPVAIQ